MSNKHDSNKEPSPIKQPKGRDDLSPKSTTSSRSSQRGKDVGHEELVVQEVGSDKIMMSKKSYKLLQRQKK